MTLTGLALPAVKVVPEIVPSVMVRLPDPTSLAEAAMVGLAKVWPCASDVTSNVALPLPGAVPALTVATALLAICGVGASVPPTISECSDVASVDVRFIRFDASEICVVSLEFWLLYWLTWPENCATDNWSASDVALMSPLTPSDVNSASVALFVSVFELVVLELVVLELELVPLDELLEEIVVISIRTVDCSAG